MPTPPIHTMTATDNADTATGDTVIFAIITAFISCTILRYHLALLKSIIRKLGPTKIKRIIKDYFALHRSRKKMQKTVLKQGVQINTLRDRADQERHEFISDPQ